MQKGIIKQTVLIAFVVAVACVALALANKEPHQLDRQPPIMAEDGMVSLSGRLAQEKVFTGGEGKVALALTMAAASVTVPQETPARHVDLVVVLDRSGSMEGGKLESAKKAVMHVVQRLAPQDRFALVTYANGVTQHTGLIPATADNRNLIRIRTAGVRAGGGTNLGAGLERSIHTLMRAQDSNNIRKIILISDGLANQGMTDLYSLGQMASQAVEGEFAVSTVGVGNDFNEVLMTHIADHGQGTYTFLEDPVAFANVFWEEFRSARMAAATNIEIRVPLVEGFVLTDAAGYPIERQNGVTVIRPGSLGSEQTRKLFLTFDVPTSKRGEYTLAGIELRYSSQGNRHRVRLPGSFTVACVDDPHEALASIVSEEWEEKVLQDDYGRLKEEVAGDIRAGRKDKALKRIEAYRKRQETVNTAVKSPAVARNLDEDLEELQDTVGKSFAGPPAQAAQKRKKTAKSLQYESYGERRQK